MATLKEITEFGERIDMLENLALVLADSIDVCSDTKSLAQLARQYRETLKELEELQGKVKNDDEINEILSNRQAEGKSRAIRKSNTRV